jgi:hypothetical protein
MWTSSLPRFPAPHLKKVFVLLAAADVLGRRVDLKPTAKDRSADDIKYPMSAARGDYRGLSGPLKYIIAFVALLGATTQARADSPPEVQAAPGEKAAVAPSGNVSTPEAGSEQAVQVSIPTGSVSVDPLGIAMWGLSFSGEYNFGPASATLMYRFIGAGFASQMTITETHEFIDPLRSFGLGLRGNIYGSPTLSGAHLGLGLEYARVAVEEEDYKDLTASHYLIPSAHVGYRFALGSFFLNPSASVNYAFFAGRSLISRDVSDPEALLRDGLQPSLENNYLGGDVRFEVGHYF